MQTTLIIKEEELTELLKLIKFNNSLESVYWQLRSIEEKAAQQVQQQHEKHHHIYIGSIQPGAQDHQGSDAGLQTHRQRYFLIERLRDHRLGNDAARHQDGVPGDPGDRADAHAVHE